MSLMPTRGEWGGARVAPEVLFQLQQRGWGWGWVGGRVGGGGAVGWCGFSVP